MYLSSRFFVSAGPAEGCYGACCNLFLNIPRGEQQPARIFAKAPTMSFRLWTIFYVFALVAAALATFGAFGIVAAGYVLAFWAWVFYAAKGKFTLLHLLLAFAAVGMLIALLLPAFSTAREAARRNMCMSNLKVLIVALIGYQRDHGTLPPAYIADASGKPMHSWRVLILPYLERQDLYDRYNFNEPWDGPNNRTLAPLIGDVFHCPGHGGEGSGSETETHYFAVVGPATIFPGVTGGDLSGIKDGAKNTIMLIEATGQEIGWMEPRDLTVGEAVELMAGMDHGHIGIRDRFLWTSYYSGPWRNVAFGDGHIEHVGRTDDTGLAKALLTVAGGEPLPARINWDSRPDDRRELGTFAKWNRVYSLSVFVVLALLPLARLPRRGKQP